MYYLFIFFQTKEATIGCLNSATIGMYSSMFSGKLSHAISTSLTLVGD
jgi:hypothetical protein